MKSARKLRQLNTSRFLIPLFADWAIIVISTVLAFTVDSWWSIILGAIVVGTRQHAIGILGHDAAHGLITKNRKLNDFLGNILIFWPLASTLCGYRNFHFDHHSDLGRESDPETPYHQTPYFQGVPTRSHFILFFLKDLFGLGTIDLLSKMSAFKPQSKGAVIKLIIFWTLAALCFSYFDFLNVLIFWFICFGTTFFASFRLREYTEHTFLPGDTHRFETSGLAKFLVFPHNTCHHFEHHHFPTVPFYNLPKLRSITYQDRPVLSLSQLFQQFYSYGENGLTPNALLGAQGRFLTNTLQPPANQSL